MFSYCSSHGRSRRRSLLRHINRDTATASKKVKPPLRVRDDFPERWPPALLHSSRS